MSHEDKHVFALHSSQELPAGSSGDDFCFEDRTLRSRIVDVLRLHPGDKVILFDYIKNIHLTLSSATFEQKKSLYGVIDSIVENKLLVPSINLYCGLLKKEAFEAVAYAAAALGVARLVPVLTQKVQRVWRGEKDQERLKKIMIAAAEQSKNFVIPEISLPLTFDQACVEVGRDQNDHDQLIYFDVNGVLARDYFLSLGQKQSTKISLFVGPEGGLTSQEAEHLKAIGFSCVVLGPTVLRAREAVTIGVGLVRSFF